MNPRFQTQDDVLQLATSSSSADGPTVRAFDDGHIPENFVLPSSSSSSKDKDGAVVHQTCNPDYTTKLITYPSVMDHKQRIVHVVDQALPVELVNELYEATIQENKPWGTYVTVEQVQEFLEKNHTRERGLSKSNYAQSVGSPKDRESLVIAAAAYFFQNAWQVSDTTTNDNKTVQTYTSSKDCNPNTKTNKDALPKKSPHIWTKSDHTSAHGVAVWALASSTKAQVPYHLDYAEQIRYEHNVMVPPLLAGTLHCSDVTIKGGDFCVCLDGLDHYEQHGYKGAKDKNTTNDCPFDYQHDTEAEWVTVPYRCNRMILASGHLPHLSTPVESIESTTVLTQQQQPQSPTDNTSVKRVILGFNVFGHDYGPLVQAAPEHSDVFRRKVQLQRLLRRNQQQPNDGKASGNSDNPTDNRQRVSLEALTNNKGLSKLLVLAKREKVKRELAQAQLKLDNSLDDTLSNSEGISIQQLMDQFGTKDGQTWPSPTDVLVHINQRISRLSEEQQAKENSKDLSRSDNKAGKRRLLLFSNGSSESRDGMVLPSDVVCLE